MKKTTKKPATVKDAMHALEQKIGRLHGKRKEAALNELVTEYGAEAVATELFNGFYRNIYHAMECNE